MGGGWDPRVVRGFGWSVGFGGLGGRWVIENTSHGAGWPGSRGMHFFIYHAEEGPRLIFTGSRGVFWRVIKNLGYPLLLAHTFRRYATLRDALQMWVNF